MPKPQPGTNERVVWEFYLSYQEDHYGIPPTMDEVCEATGLNFRSSVKHIIKSLIDMRVMDEIFEEGQSRRYRALKEPKQDNLWNESPFERMISANPTVESDAP